MVEYGARLRQHGAAAGAGGWGGGLEASTPGVPSEFEVVPVCMRERDGREKGDMNPIMCEA